MVTIVVGNNRLEHVLYQLNKIETNHPKMDLSIDFCNSEFIHPNILALLSSYVEFLRLKVDVHVKCDNINVTNRDYIARMNFFDEMNIDYVEYFLRRPSTGRFIPITRVNENNRYEIPSGMSTIIASNWEGVHDSVVSSLYWAIGEVTDNIFNHAKTEVDGFVTAQYYPNKEQIDIIFIDNGIGIPKRLRENDEYAHLSNQETLEMALRHKVTVGDHEGLGQGLYYSKRIIEENKGILEIFSDNSKVTVNFSGVTTNASHYWQGTVIRFVIKTNIQVNPHNVWGDNIPPSVLDYMLDGELW